MAGDTVHITECPAELWFPTAFTPNGDGVNDFFRPKGISIARFHLMIYNRWGQLLFETGDMERGWDGASKGILCPAGTYSFIATYEGTDNPGSTKKLQGSFILVR
jgi:gliding motility-associated-like protein